MSYRCELCGGLVPPGQPKRVHTLYREAPVSDAQRRLPRRMWGAIRMEIAREIPACGRCLDAIKQGVDLHQLLTEAKGMKSPVLETKELVDKVVTSLATGTGTTNGMKGGHKVTNGKANGQANVAPPKPSKGKGRKYPKCDVCGEDATDGQVTADCVLCPFHCESSKR